MLYKNRKEIVGIHRGNKEIQAVYRGATLLWELITSLTCYSSGYWQDELPWSDEYWWVD